MKCKIGYRNGQQITEENLMDKCNIHDLGNRTQIFRCRMCTIRLHFHRDKQKEGKYYVQFLEFLNESQADAM